MEAFGFEEREISKQDQSAHLYFWFPICAFSGKCRRSSGISRRRGDTNHMLTVSTFFSRTNFCASRRRFWIRDTTLASCILFCCNFCVFKINVKVEFDTYNAHISAHVASLYSKMMKPSKSITSNYSHDTCISRFVLNII